MFLIETEDNNFIGANGKPMEYLAQSETLCTWRRSLTGTWEISILAAQAVRLSKAQAVGLT